MDHPNETVDMDDAQTWSYSTTCCSFFPSLECEDGPVIAVAGLAESAHLISLLERAEFFGEEERSSFVVNQKHGFKCILPLLRAVERQRCENVSLLLEHGANPNGISLEEQISLARRFRRFCYGDREDLDFMEVPVHTETVGTALSQIEPPYLTEHELADRRFSFAPFWAVPCCFEIDYSMDEALYNSVVMAGLSTPKILGQLIDAGADIHAWIEPLPDSLADEKDLKASELSISTPIHSAIATRSKTMLCALLDRGLSPNARAIIAGSQALTPAQYAIVIGDLETYALLTARGADPNTRTPVFGVHLLHFAAALLRVDLLEAAGMPFANASTTAMGHSLLHIATLPYNWSDFQSSAPKVLQSVHDFRGMQASHRIRDRLVYDWDYAGESSLIYTKEYQDLRNSRPFTTHDLNCESPRDWSRNYTEDHAQQEAVCKLLLQDLGSSQMGLRDKHGNTMLHYLASTKTSNLALIDWLKTQENGARIWKEITNFWGHTPEDLYEDGESARARPREADNSVESCYLFDREEIFVAPVSLH